MKKQGSFYLKIISISLAVFMLVYLLSSILIDSGISHTLETAVYCEVGDGETVSGFVVREEKVLVSTAPILVCELTEGERVGSGQAVATGYNSDDARQTREQLFSLQNQREQLAMAALETDGRNNDILNDRISALLVSIASQTKDRQLDAMRTYVTELEPLVLRRCVSGDDAEQIQSRINRIDARLRQLTGQSTADATSITVSQSGYFSQCADGYERVLTPETILTMSAQELRTMAENRTSISPDAFGRLITGQRWYFVAEIPLQRMELCTVGNSLTVSFAGEGLQELKMRIERAEESDGACILVLSCAEKMQRVTALREQSAEIIFDTIEGIRIPKQALYFVDGLTGVYVLEAGRAEWKTVDELLQYGNYYLVEWDRSSTSGLWPDDQIILTEEYITDGTVIGE